VRARGTDRWEVVASVKDPLTGAHRKVSRVVRGTKKDAERRLSQLLVEADAGFLTPGDAAVAGTFAELLDQWLDRKRSEGLSPSTIARYAQASKLLRAELGTRKLDQLDTATIDALYARLLRSGQSPASIAKVAQVARASLDLAVTYGRLRSNPAAGAKPPKVLRPDKDAPEPEVVKQLIAYAKQERYFHLSLLIRLGAATGARRGELCALKWTDFDFEGDPPSMLVSRVIVHGEGGAVIERPVTKTGKSRRVTLDPGTVQTLMDWRAEREKFAADCGCELPADAYVFSYEPEGNVPPRPDGFTQAFNRISRELGLDCSLYEATRHFAGSTMIANGVDVTTAAARLGHSATTLLKRYSHVRAGADAKAAGVVGSSLD
jgi:integrase